MGRYKGVGFCFKQKTAYEIEYGLVGSEMCIRDGIQVASFVSPRAVPQMADTAELFATIVKRPGTRYTCLLYTSDAADDLPCVDLGGRRITNTQTTTNCTP